MEHNTVDVTEEFGKQVQRYLTHYGLLDADLVRLIGSNTDVVKKIIEGTRGVVIKTAESISNIFGLRYFEFGNPLFPFPSQETLPEKTQNAIKRRKKVGIQDTSRNLDLKLPSHIKDVITSNNFPEEFTSSDILKLLPEYIQQNIQSFRITYLITKGKLRELVENTNKIRKTERKGKGRGETLFRLKKNK